MRVRGDNAPSNVFSLEEQPKKPGFCLVRFYENVQPYSEEQEGRTITGYEYDEYHLEVADYDGLFDDILGNFDSFLAQAKIADGGEEPGGMEERVAALEADKADRSDIQAVWDQMAAAYNEGVQEA